MMARATTAKKKTAKKRKATKRASPDIHVKTMNPLEPMEMSLNPDEVVKLPSDGPLPPSENMIQVHTDVLGFKDKAAALAFNEEKLTIMIHDTTDENADQLVFLSVNGRGVWLERAQQYKISRKYVEVLCRAKPFGIETVQARDFMGNQTTNIKKSSALRYPFSVLNDPNPNGAAWLRSILAQ